MQSVKLFVYGTLMQGFHNHYLLGGAKFVGPATTQENYSMYVSGIPYVSEKPATYPIEGEVYEVDKYTLEDLDRLEGHPVWYQRKEIPVVLNESKELISANLYFNEEPKGSLQKEGNYRKAGI